MTRQHTSNLNKRLIVSVLKYYPNILQIFPELRSHRSSMLYGIHLLLIVKMHYLHHLQPIITLITKKLNNNRRIQFYQTKISYQQLYDKLLNIVSLHEMKSIDTQIYRLFQQFNTRYLPNKSGRVFLMKQMIKIKNEFAQNQNQPPDQINLPNQQNNQEEVQNQGQQRLQNQFNQQLNWMLMPQSISIYLN